MKLRVYQQELHDAIVQAWAAGARVVAAQLPTGGGKTVTFAHIVAEEPGPCVVMAHRRELIIQMSVALAREGVRHRVIGPPLLSRLCSAAHMEELGRDFVNPQALVAVASVQTLATMKQPGEFFAKVRLWVGDEGHHYTRDNLFGRVVTMMPNARGLLVTATPGRSDGLGLGSHADGIVDVLVRGPDVAWMIEQGHLSKYRIYAPPSTFNRAAIHLTASGELNAAEVREETRRSTVMGDIVEHYCKHASGKLGLTFADSIENATTIVEKFRAAGVGAELLTGKTPDALRTSILRKFRARQVMQIVSVSLIDEGFDCPGVEVVSDGAATESLNRYRQRFGRGLRPLPGKTHMIYFDHVGNVQRHKLPDAPVRWSLDRRDRRGSTKGDDAIPVRSCPQCTAVYERVHKECPFCGHYPEPAPRRGPDEVEGELAELDPALMRVMLSEVTRVDGAAYAPEGVGQPAAMAIARRHRERQEAQRTLRETMALWGGWRELQGDALGVAQRRFWHVWGLDVLTAQTLGAREAGELNDKLRAALAAKGVAV